MENILRRKIAQLYSKYGPQGWWPRLIMHDNQITVKHHPGPVKIWELSEPAEQIWEVMVGAILTQNTNWKNVEEALVNLHSAKLILPKELLQASERRIRQAVRPSGYYVQKTKKLCIAAKWFVELDWKSFAHVPLKGQRNEILSLWGIGPETADTILLYGMHEPSFVVDAYTRRLFSCQLDDQSWLECPYDFLKSECERMFQNNPKSQPDIVAWWREVHALIVRWGKEQ